MKKTLLSIAAACVAFVSVNAQIVNADFEAWTQGGTSPNTYMDPDGWSTLNSSTAILGIFTTEKETSNVHGGSGACKQTTRFIGFPINQMAPSIVTNGTINTQTQAVEGGQAFTERPTSFTGWYVASPQNSDSYSFGALLINENTGDTVGSASWEGSATVSTYTMFTADVTYTSQDNPTILQIILLSSDPTNPQENSTATYDDLGYTTNTVGTEEFDIEIIRTYPNPVVDKVFFNLGSNEEANITLYNVIGSKVATAKLTKDANSMDLSLLPAGTYVWQFADANGNVIKTDKLIVTK